MKIRIENSKCGVSYDRRIPSIATVFAGSGTEWRVLTESPRRLLVCAPFHCSLPLPPLHRPVSLSNSSGNDGGTHRRLVRGSISSSLHSPCPRRHWEFFSLVSLIFFSPLIDRRQPWVSSPASSTSSASTARRSPFSHSFRLARCRSSPCLS